MARMGFPAGLRLFERPYLLLTLTALLWAGNLVVGRYVAGSMPPALFAFVRWFFASALALPFAWPYLVRDWPVLRRHFPIMLAYGVLGLALNNALVYFALGLTQATNALVLQSFGPLVIALWSFVLLKERLSGRQILGLVVSLAGVLTVLTKGDWTLLLRLKLNAGDLWLMAATASYGLYAVLLRYKPPLHALSFLVAAGLLGAALLVPVAALELWARAPVVVNAGSLFSLAYVCLFPSLVAFLFFNRGVELIGPNRAGVFIHLMPLFGAGLAVLFLGERPQFFHAMGLVLILSGVFLAARHPRPAVTAKAAEEF